MVLWWWVCGRQAVERGNESEMRSGFSGLAIAIQTPLPRGPLRAASPLPSATYPPLRSGAFRQRPSCERSPHFTNLGRWLGHWRAPSGRGLRPRLPSLRSARLARVAFLVFDNRLFLRVRVSKTASSRRRGDAGDKVAQRKARRLSAKQARRKSAALFLPPSAGVAPSIGTLARVAERGGFRVG